MPAEQCRHWLGIASDQGMVLPLNFPCCRWPSEVRHRPNWGWWSWARRAAMRAATMLALDLLASALSASAGVLAETTHADHAVEGSDGR